MLKIHRNTDFLLHFKRNSQVLWQLSIQPQVSSNHREELRVSAATREETRLPHLNSRGVLTPLLLFERYPQIPITTRKEPRVSCCKWKGHWVPPHLKISPDSPAATQMEPRVSPQNMKGGLNPLLQVEKNPEFPASTWGGLTPLSQLERKVEFHASTWDEPWLPCWNWIGTPRSTSQLRKNPEFPASTWDEALFPCSDLRGIPRSPLQLKRRPDSPEATQEEPWVSGLNSQWGEAQFPCSNSRGIWSAPSQFKRMPDSPGATGQVTWDQCCNSSGTPSFPLQLKKNNQIHLSTQDEARFPCGNLRAILTSPWQVERGLDSLFATQEVTQDISRNWRGTPSIPSQLEMRPNSPDSHNWGAPHN